MNFDTRLVGGLFIGMLLGLHYHESLLAYLPFLILVTVILGFKIIHR